MSDTRPTPETDAATLELLRKSMLVLAKDRGRNGDKTVEQDIECMVVVISQLERERDDAEASRKVNADLLTRALLERDEARERANSKHGLWMMELHKVTELEAQVQAMLKNDVSKLESDSFVGSCTCLTKTPDIQYHKPGCKYRLICERDEARAALSGRTVSCSQCNEAAKQIESMREAIKEAHNAKDQA